MDKEERTEYNKKYYTKNRDNILKKASEKITCKLCNREISKYHRVNHMKSKICQKYQDILKYENTRLSE